MGGIIKKLISLIIAMVVCGALTVGATGEKKGTELWCTGEDFGAAAKVGQGGYGDYDYSRSINYAYCSRCGHSVGWTFYDYTNFYGSRSYRYNDRWCGVLRGSDFLFKSDFSGVDLSCTRLEYVQQSFTRFIVDELVGRFECSYCNSSGDVSLSTYYQKTGSESVPYDTYRFVPEFTPTAIKLKNCRFSPHDGINSQRKEVV